VRTVCNDIEAAVSKIEIPTLVTAWLRLRVFRAGDLDTYAAMQAKPEVMRPPVTGAAACGAS
jgi:hypothetical protein